MSRGWSGVSRKDSFEALDRAEIELARAPLQHADLIESVVLQPIDQLQFEGLNLAGHAEGAVIHVASGAAGDLAKLGRHQIAMHLAVEFAQAREGNVIEIEIEAHADGVGRYQEIDIAVLIERNLCIARAGESAPSTTAPPPRWRLTNSAMA